MNIGIVTTGSRGDVQPFIALSLALIKRGHDITLLAPENFKAFVEGFGIKYLSLAGNGEQLINTPAALKLLQGGNLLKFFHQLQKLAEKPLVQQNREILEGCKHMDNLIVSVLPFPIVYSVAEKFNKKCVVVFLSLPPVPTGEFPYPLFGLKGAAWFNRLSYNVVQLAYLTARKKIDVFRKQIGLPKRNVLRHYLACNMLTILPMTKELVKQPADWPSNTHVTGFFNLPAAARAAQGVDGEIPAGLESWLVNGSKPVYIGFGSIPVPDRNLFYKVLKEVLAEKRVVFGLGWSILDEVPQHPNLFVTKYVNHDWLLPQCSTAVIHGGIGTICTVMRAGIPMVVVSVLADQPIYGKIIGAKKLGCHIPFKKLSAEKLLTAINVTQSPAMIEHCRQVGERLRLEDGTAEAVELIEKYFG